MLAERLIRILLDLVEVEGRRAAMSAAKDLPPKP